MLAGLCKYTATAPAGIVLNGHSIAPQKSGSPYVGAAFAVTAGDQLYAFLGGLSLSTTTAPTLSDTDGNTWTAVEHSTNNMAGWLFTATAASTNAALVVTAAAATNFFGYLLCGSVSGSSGVRTHASSNDYASSLSLTTASGPAVGDLVVAFCASNQTGTITFASTPATTLIDQGLDAANYGGTDSSGYYTVATAGAQTVGWTIASANKINNFIIVYKP